MDELLNVGSDFLKIMLDPEKICEINISILESILATLESVLLELDGLLFVLRIYHVHHFSYMMFLDKNVLKKIQIQT